MAGLLLIENLTLFLLTIALGRTLVRAFEARRIVPRADSLTSAELAFAGSCVLLNTLVTLAGWWLWKKGLIQVRREVGLGAIVDVLVLLMAMDLGMYVTHRVAHLPLMYKWIHAPHHRYRHPRALTLFVLHPLEVLGFGALWLLLITLYSATSHAAGSSWRIRLADFR